MFPFSNLSSQPNRPMTAAEQRQADIQVGEVAAALAELRGLFLAPLRLLGRIFPSRRVHIEHVVLVAQPQRGCSLN